MSCLQDTNQFAVVGIIFIRAEYVDVRFRSLTIDVWMQIQITLVVMTFEFGQDTSFVGDHLIFAEVRLGYCSVMAGYTVTV